MFFPADGLLRLDSTLPLPGRPIGAIVHAQLILLFRQGCLNTTDYLPSVRVLQGVPALGPFESVPSLHLCGEPGDIHTFPKTPAFPVLILSLQPLDTIRYRCILLAIAAHCGRFRLAVCPLPAGVTVQRFPRPTVGGWGKARFLVPNQGVSGWEQRRSMCRRAVLGQSSLLPFESLRIARRGERPSAGSFAVASEGRRRWHRCAQISQKSLSESGPLRGGKSVFASPLAVSSFERASKRNSAGDALRRSAEKQFRRPDLRYEP